MTDEEIVRLLDDKDPQDISVEVLRLIHERMRGSRAVRDAIKNRLSLEQCLGAVLGRVDVRVDELFREAGAPAASAGRGARTPLVLAVLLITAVWLAVCLSPPRENKSAMEEFRAEARVDSTRETARQPSIPVETAAMGKKSVEPPVQSEVPTIADAVAPSEKAAQAPATTDAAPIHLDERLSMEPTLEYGGEVKSFVESCFDDFDGERSFPSKSELERWLAPVDGNRAELSERDEGGTRSARFDGVFELKPGSNWGPDVVLRLSLFGSRGFKLHFWRGQEGVTLEHFPKTSAWAAYETSRSGQLALPGSFQLAATDEGRWRRSGEGTFELRQEDGLLVLSRGNLLLLAAPIPGPIEKVYFEGRATVRGIAMYRGTPFPLIGPVAVPALLKVERPADVEWKTSLADGTKLEKLGDGAVALSAADAKAVSWAAITAGGESSYDAVFEVDDASPGTGIYLGDAEGRPVHAVGFFRGPRDSLVLAFARAAEARTSLDVDEEKGPIPYAGRSVRLRLTAEGGVLRCCVSPDGARWSEALPSFEMRPATASLPLLGIYCTNGGGLRRIVLRRIEVRAPGAVAVNNDESILSEASEPALRTEILGLVYRGAWEDVRALTRRLKFFGRPSDPSSRLPRERARLLALAEWADALAWKRSPRHAPAGTAAAPGLQQPLIEEVSKEGFNILAELDGALAGRSYREACEIIVSARTQAVSGLVPDAKEPDLLVSLSGAVTLAMRDHPALAQTMLGEFGPLGRLRLKEAVAQGDAAAVEAVALQFYGTAAAAEASLWMGDRFLAAGDFTRAASQYRQTIAGCAPDLRPGTSARLRLASAYLGQGAGPLIEGPVELGGERFSSGELNALSKDLSQGRASGVLPAVAQAAQSSRDGAAPPPSALNPKTWARVEHAMERRPSGVPEEGSGWVRRQLALSVGGGLRLLCDRSQVIAWDAATGERKWAEVLKEDSGRWPFVAMKPLILCPRIITRRMTASGPELIALECASGNLLWRARPGHHVASDPMIARDQLVAVTVTTGEEGVLELYLTTFDPAAGAVIARGLLAKFRDVWDRQIPCRAAVADDKIVLSAGGAVICCDLLGQLLWLRRQPLLFPPQDLEWFEQEHSPPLVAGGHLLVSQPGFRCLECLDLLSGRLEWRRVIPRFAKIAGPTMDRIIVATPGEIIALGIEKGEQAWRLEAPRLVDVPLSSDPGGLVYECLEGDNQAWPCIVWLDAVSGRETGRASLKMLARARPSLGPIASFDGRIWTLIGRSDSKEMEVVELAPQGK